jgi:hypothetical protein
MPILSEMSARTIKAAEEMDKKMKTNVCLHLLLGLTEPATFARACYDFIQEADVGKSFVEFLEERNLPGCAKEVKTALGMGACFCNFSDAWKCARDQNRTDRIACECSCHKYLEARSRERK